MSTLCLSLPLCSSFNSPRSFLGLAGPRSNCALLSAGGAKQKPFLICFSPGCRNWRILHPLVLVHRGGGGFNTGKVSQWYILYGIYSAQTFQKAWENWGMSSRSHVVEEGDPQTLPTSTHTIPLVLWIAASPRANHHPKMHTKTAGEEEPTYIDTYCRRWRQCNVRCQPCSTTKSPSYLPTRWPLSWWVCFWKRQVCCS